IKELVIVADYCADEYIVEYAKNRFSNKEKYMEMKEQYKQ
ncbi:29260_t:CDS:2, partial [Gigaspora margarita]